MPFRSGPRNCGQSYAAASTPSASTIAASRNTSLRIHSPPARYYSILSGDERAQQIDTKVGFIGQVASQSPDLLAELPDPQDAFGLRYLHPELEIVAVGVGGRRVPTHGHPRGARGRSVGRHDGHYRSTGE